jgi:hypothetical protein
MYCIVEFVVENGRPPTGAYDAMNKLKGILLIVLLIAIIGIPRLVGLGKFTSIDEPFWLHQSANFYYALGQRQFENTIYEYHPAVTTMWIISLGMLAYFPEYRALGQGYLKQGKFELFMASHGKDPLQLLIVSRTLQVVIIILLLLIVYFLLKRMFDDRSAFFTTALISVSPFFLGQSRLLNHEALLGLFLLISLLGLLVYLYVERKMLLLLLSSCAGALGQLTKSSGIPLVPIIFLVLLVYAITTNRNRLGQGLLEAGRTFGIWLIALAFFYILFWPGMWVAPGKMLYEVYGNAFSYTFQGMRLSVLPGLETAGFKVDTLRTGLEIYFTDLIWRTTVVSWLGGVAGLWMAVVFITRKTGQNYLFTFFYSAILALAFILLFSIQQGPKPPHYILTSYISLDLIAGLGFAHALEFLADRVPKINRGWGIWASLGIILMIQLISAAGFYPYYITYNNPVTKALLPQSQNPTVKETGYGVGLDQAADYLSNKVGAGEMTVLSANGYGSFSYYFPGKTTPMNDLDLSDPVIVGILKGSQYAVVDYYNQKRIGLLTGFKDVKPEKIIWINGIEYLHIYRAADLLATIGISPP